MSGGQSNVPWKEAVKCLAPRWGRDEWMRIFSGDFSLAIQWQREAEQIILLCICQWIPKEAVTTIFRDPLKYISRIVGIHCHTCRRLLSDIKSVEYLDKTHQWIINTTKGGCHDNISRYSSIYLLYCWYRSHCWVRAFPGYQVSWILGNATPVYQRLGLCSVPYSAMFSNG